MNIIVNITMKKQYFLIIELLLQMGKETNVYSDNYPRYFWTNETYNKFKNCQMVRISGTNMMEKHLTELELKELSFT